MTVPVSMYRIQLADASAFQRLAELAPYLAKLGVSHAYLSPILAAAPGSQHGYDVVDHGNVSFELGGEEAFREAAAALKQHGIGIVLDIVPNHMALPVPEYLNNALWGLLRDGPESQYARWFDLADDQEIVLPILGQRINECIDAGELVVGAKGGPDGAPVLRYYDHVVPLRPGTESLPLEELLAAQYYRLAYWKVASEELNYRRFFDVDTLVALRVERKEVFDASHSVILRLMKEGLVDGLRVDHPDGLADPIQYLQRLQDAVPDGAWIVIEKILALDEELDPQLVCDGTTGYDALQRIGGLFVDPSGKPVLTTAFGETSGITMEWAQATELAKRDVLSEILIAEVDRLATIAHGICQADVRLRDHSLRGLADAIYEILVGFEVYRAYVVPGEPAPAESIRRVDSAIAFARERVPHRGPEFDLVRKMILGTLGEGGLRDEFLIRFQQVCGAVMAKGVEDTANYRWFPLAGLCEVGSEADVFGVTADEFHTWAANRQQNWPGSLNALSTHDAKRSEDVRARLAAISEIPGEWATTVNAFIQIAGGLRVHAPLDESRRATDPGHPDGGTEWLLWQTLIGAWPINAARLKDYMIKAVREAKQRTSWNDPNSAYEESLLDYIDGVLANDSLISAVEQVVERLHPAFVTNCLGQRAIQLLTPGIPDIYNGCEAVFLRLVDPDNRTAPDRSLLSAILDEALARVPSPGNDLDLAKARLTGLGLQLRAKYPQAVGADGSYLALRSGGSNSEHIVGCCRGGTLAVLATRLPIRLIAKGGWGLTSVELPPGTWRNVLTATVHHSSDAQPWRHVTEVLGAWPVALLERTGD